MSIYYRKSRKKYELTVDGKYIGSFNSRKKAQLIEDQLTATLETYQPDFEEQNKGKFNFHPIKALKGYMKKKHGKSA